MDYVKKVANKVSTIAHSVFIYPDEISMDTQNQELQHLLYELFMLEQDHVSTIKLDKLVAFSYDIEDFNYINTFLFKNLTRFKYSGSGIARTLNLLIIITYLIKHGASGFIDEFRSRISLFEYYQKIEKRFLFEDQKLQYQLETNIDNIKSKARRIGSLLTDKEKLLKQKSLAMLIKQKMRLFETKDMKLFNEEMSLTSQKQPLKSPRRKEAQYKCTPFVKRKKIGKTINDILQTYIWKYIDQLDDKIEDVTIKVINKLDQYVNKFMNSHGSTTNFEIDDLEGDENKVQLLMDSNKPQMISTVSDHHQLIQNITKEIQEIEIKSSDLLDYDQSTRNPNSNSASPIILIELQ